MRILAIAKSYGGVEYHRIYTPLKRLQIDYPKLEIFTAETLQENMPYDLVIFCRYLYEDHYNTITKLKELGIPYIIDIDDFWRVPKFHHAYKYYRDNNVTDAIKDAITYAAGVTVTTEKLASEVRRLNHNVSILPNVIEWTDEQWAEPIERRKKSKVRFGWVGGISHENDLHLIHEPMKYILDRYEDVEFHICGAVLHEPIWQRISKACHPRTLLHEPMNLQNYGKMYSLFDVMIAPLEDSKYNNMKSELKVIEAAEYKLPVIASNVSPYKELKDNLGITLVNPSEWAMTLERFVLSDRSIDGEHNYKYCREHYDIEKVNAKRLAFYKRICKSAIKDHG